MQKAFGIHTMEVNTYSDNGDNVTKAEGVADWSASRYFQSASLSSGLIVRTERRQVIHWLGI